MSRHFVISCVHTGQKGQQFSLRHDRRDAYSYAYITNERLIENSQYFCYTRIVLNIILHSSIHNSTLNCSDLCFIFQTWFNVVRSSQYRSHCSSRRLSFQLYYSSIWPSVPICFIWHIMWATKVVIITSLKNVLTITIINRWWRRWISISRNCDLHAQILIRKYLAAIFFMQF